jgi:hypothetical protein
MSADFRLGLRKDYDLADGPAGGGATDRRRNKTAPDEGRVTRRGSISMRTIRGEKEWPV